MVSDPVTVAFLADDLKEVWEFPDSPVVRLYILIADGPRFSPQPRGTMIPQATGMAKKEKERERNVILLLGVSVSSTVKWGQLSYTS